MLLLLLGCSGPEAPPIDTAAPLDPHLVPGPEVRCDDAEGREVHPYQREELGGGWPLSPIEADGFRRGGQGVAVADLDGDRLPDLFVPRLEFPSLVLLGSTGGFLEAPDWLPDAVDRAIGASAADADGDGDVDVVVSRLDAPALLLRNTGGALAPEVLPVPADGPEGCGASASWADFDLDGDLDLLLGRADRAAPSGTREPCESWLLENRDGTFTAIAGALSEDVRRDRVLAAGWLPLDDDPWPELYVVSDLPASTPGNRVLDNDGGVLDQVDGHSLELRIAGMGLATADLDDDGRIDLFVPGIDEYALLVSSEAGPWIESSTAWGLRPDPAAGQHTAWGGALEDLDNDGLEDLVVAFGPTADEGTVVLDQPDAVHRQEPPGTFSQVGVAWDLDDERSVRSIVVADLDGDGFLDLVRRELGAGIRVDRARCDGSGWLELRLHQGGGNPSAVGAVVTARAGDDAWMRLVTAGSTGYASSRPPLVHLGLGPHDGVDDLMVTWPDGEVLELGAVGGRRVVDVYREARR